MTDERQVLLERLIALGEQHLAAARALDASRIQAILEERSALVFALSVALQDGVPGDPEAREALRDGAKRLRALERRTHQVATIVLGALGRVIPEGALASRAHLSRPRTYERTGRIRP